MEMYFAAVLAFCVTAIATGLLIPRAGKLGLIDKPGGHRDHDAPTPAVGGFAIFAGIVLGVWLVMQSGVAAWSYLCGAALLVAAGYIDDRHVVSAPAKGIAQIGAAIVLCVGGNVVIRDMGDLLGQGAIQWGWFAWPFTVFAIVGLINAMNMLDGLDGLAGSVAVAIAIPLLYVALHMGAAAEVGYILVFIGAVVGFLCFNFRHNGRPARTFMGDTGSMLLGYTLAWFVITLSQEPSQGLHPMAVLWLLIVPVMDTFRLMLLRARKRASPFAADKRHLHHLLFKAGMSVNQIVAFAFGLTLVSATIALYLQTLPTPGPVLFYGFAGLFLLYLGFGAYLGRHILRSIRRPSPQPG